MKSGGSSALVITGVLLAVGAVLARRKAQGSVAPKVPEPTPMGRLEAAARTLQAMFVVAGVFIFGITYATSASSSFMFWAFIGSMGIIVITHLYLYFKTLEGKGWGN